MRIRPLGLGLGLVLAVLSARPAAAAVAWSQPSGANGQISYTGGQEDKGLYGDPTVTGNTFTFLTPNAFVAQASNNTAATTTDTLSVNVKPAAGKFLTSVVVHEFGDYSIFGDLAGVKVTGALYLTYVTPTNATPVLLPGLSPTVVYTNTATNVSSTVRPTGTSDGLFSVDYVYNLPANVTGLQISLNNNLQALAPGATTALVQKDGVSLTVNTTVPEPATAGLVAAGAMLLGVRLRKQRTA